MTTRMFAALAASVLALASASCKDSAPAPGGPPGGGSAARPGGAGRAPSAFPVETRAAQAQRVEYELSAVGQLEAFEQVQVTARVEGAVERVLFQEGDVVKAGQSLAAIEPERFRLEVAARRAALERAEAEAAEARAAVARREAAISKTPGLIPAEEIESWQTRSEASGAAVAQARVALQQAELDLDDARVRAPSAGIIQTRTVQTGQYVNEGDVLATLVQRSPLLLRFEVPEPDAARLAAGMDVRFRVRSMNVGSIAKITHVAAEADAASRMVRVTAHVVDDSPDLRPGAFAEVVVPIGANDAAVVVPDTAIRPSERGFLAYVVEGDVARERVVELGLRTKEGAVELRQGVSVGELVVIRGAEALRDGATVRQVTGAEADRTAGAGAGSGSGS